MGRKLLGYDDAVKLLGGESKTLAALSKLAGAGIAGVALVGLAHGNVPAAVGLFELKGEIVSLGQQTDRTLRHRLTGLSRFQRSELLEAAHAVLVVSAFFAALDDLDAELGTALNSASLEVVRTEQAALASSPSRHAATGLADLARQLTVPGQIPGLDGGLASPGRSLADYYASLARNVRGFAAGTAVWDQRDETTRDKWSRAVTEGLPRRALARYEEQLVRLSGEFPEFAFWANRIGIQAILKGLRASRRDTAQLGSTLQTITGLLAAAAYGPDPGKVRSDLTARYREQIAKPIAGVATGTVPEGVQLPALRQLYINPSYRTLPLLRATGGIEQITDPRWRETSPHRDLGAMVLEHLISTQAAQVPLVLLGQPGAGKSVFTQMLAAELDPRDYLVVRVKLRAVLSDINDIQKQIEAGLHLLTGRSISWPDLTESAGNAQPVVLLDGFDELLQASGVSHFDFLEQIQAFQEREAELRRPVAVMVTSRTAVANQVRYPDGTPVARLEEFDSDQVSDWLHIWNNANPGRPLAAQTALAQGELARQPLLLFLLALFHSGGGNLTPGISQAHLFEWLFTDFVERDVDKLKANLTERQQQHTVQRDLDHLSMVAFAMFNRGLQSVTESDLIADLTALQPENLTTPGPTARAAALSIAERIAGRFFFRLLVHRDQAMRGQQITLSTYEFLHASFGEFLIGRWVVNELSRLSEQARRAADDRDPSPPDDSKLHALLSVTVLSVREQRVLGFMADLLANKAPEDLADLRALTGTLFRGCLQSRGHDPYSQYQPSVRTAPASYAAYSANLLLLLLLISEAQCRTAEESGGAGLSGAELDILATRLSPTEKFAKLETATRLWHSQLTPSEWRSLLDVVRIRPQQEVRVPLGTMQEPSVSRWREEDYQLPTSGHEILYGSSHTFLERDRLIWLDTRAGSNFREAGLLGISGYEDACSALLPYINAVSLSGAASELQMGGGAAQMLALLIPSPGIAAKERAMLYIAVFGQLPGIRPARLLLERLRDDIRHLPPMLLARTVLEATPYAWAHINAYLDIVSQAYELSASQGSNFEVEIGALIDLSGRMIGQPIFDEMALRQRQEKVSLITLARPRPLLRLSYSQALSDFTEPSDLSGLLRLAEPYEVHDEIDPREVLGVYDLPELLRLVGVLDLLHLEAPLDPLDLRDLNDLNGHFDQEYSGANISLVLIALWAGLAQGQLAVAAPPPALMESDVHRLQSIAPDFVSRTRRLAAEKGFPDPLPGMP